MKIVPVEDGNCHTPPPAEKRTSQKLADSFHRQASLALPLFLKLPWDLQRRFYLYAANKSSSVPIVMLALFATFRCLFIWTTERPSSNLPFSYISDVVVSIFQVAPLWCFIMLPKVTAAVSEHALESGERPSRRRWKLLYRLQSFIVIACCASAGTELVMRVVHGTCSGFSVQSVWHCNPEISSLVVPQDSLVLTLLYPMVLSILFRGLQLQIILLGWCISVGCACTAVSLISSTQSVYCIMTASLASLLCIVELERFSVEAFLDTVAVLSVDQNGDQFADELDSFLCPASLPVSNMRSQKQGASAVLQSNKYHGSAFAITELNGTVGTLDTASHSEKKKLQIPELNVSMLSSKSGSEKLTVDGPTPKQQRKSAVLETIGLGSASRNLGSIKEAESAPDALLELKNMIANVAHDLKTVILPDFSLLAPCFSDLSFVARQRFYQRSRGGQYDCI
jgi:hypothetical protein